jgi:hypothetical protein
MCNPEGVTEADIQSDVRTLLLYGRLDLEEKDLVVVEAQAGGGRRIDVETGTAAIEVKRDLSNAAAHKKGCPAARRLRASTRPVCRRSTSRPSTKLRTALRVGQKQRAPSKQRGRKLPYLDGNGEVGGTGFEPVTSCL